MHYGIYALWLKNGVGCSLKYGRRHYDYAEGTVVCFAPGQMVQAEPTNTDAMPQSIGLLFHPDLIHGTALSRKMERYTFFSYDEAEALHLSERERHDYMEILESIHKELDHPIDKHSRELLCDRIGLLLDLCLRFYDRQFITREVVNQDLLADFDRHLNTYFKDGLAARKGFPTVAYFADKLCLSTGYFGDLIKKETGTTAQRYIQNKIIDLSKRDLLGSTLSVSEIAYNLGFDYPQHFTRLFKKQTGLSPTEYRNQIN
jgi:AraC-like DNA-binding protein